MLAVRGPHQVADVGVVTLRGLDRGLGGGVVEIDLVLSGDIADVGDPLAVRAPGSAALVGSGGVGDIPCDTLAHRDVEDLAADCRDSPLAVRGNADAATAAKAASATALHLLVFGTGIDEVGDEGDVDLLGLLRGGIELVEVATLLEDHQLAVGAGELHVEVIERGNLGRGLCLGVIDKDVHRHVAVRGEIDLIADPHREYVLSGVVGDLLDGLPVIDPDLVGHTSAVVLPGAELPHHTVVSQFCPVGGIAAETSLGKRQLLGHAALDGDLPELAGEALAGAVAVDDVLAVDCPTHHDVVGAHTVAKIIPGVGGRVGQTDRLTAASGDDVNLAVAVILSREGDGLAVRGIFGEHLIADVRGQPLGLAARQGR